MEKLCRNDIKLFTDDVFKTEILLNCSEKNQQPKPKYKQNHVTVKPNTPSNISLHFFICKLHVSTFLLFVNWNKATNNRIKYYLSSPTKFSCVFRKTIAPPSIPRLRTFLTWLFVIGSRATTGFLEWKYDK